jgi:hypothetical protein
VLGYVVKPISSSSSSDVFFESSFNSNIKDTVLSITKVVTLASKHFFCYLLTKHNMTLSKGGVGGIGTCSYRSRGAAPLR